MRFGETADEFGKRRQEMDDDIWIKGFKDGSTRVRFLQPTGVWVTYREHYSEGPGFFPCSEDTTTCPGCNDSSEKVQKRNRRYAMNCLGESGRVDVHKVGSRLYKTLKGREQRLETIMDRDYTIIRSGKALDTIYDVEPGDRYALDDADSLELHDIGAILESNFRKACEAYGIDLEDEADDDDEPDIEAAARAALVKEGVAKPAKAEKETPPPAEPEDAHLALRKGNKQVADVDTDVLRSFLTEVAQIEFPARAPRARLEKLTATWIDANPDF